jgi:hypothetical protein
MYLISWLAKSNPNLKGRFKSPILCGLPDPNDDGGFQGNVLSTVERCGIKFQWEFNSGANLSYRNYRK